MSLSEVRWIDLPSVADSRGVLTSIESCIDVPFEIRRLFFMHGVQGERGGHALRLTSQVLLSAAGRFTVDVSDGADSASHTVNDPNRGLYLPPMTWVRLYDFTPGAVCLVVADTHFAESAYLRDWDEFVNTSRSAQAV
jgi:hypothetical protein